MIKIIPYDTVYENQIQVLYDIPVSGFIALSLQRKPHSMYGAHIQTETPNVYIAIDTVVQRVVGLFNIGCRFQIYQRTVQNLPYFCDLRISPSHQNGRVFLAMIRYVQSLGLNLDLKPATTIVFADNSRMIQMIEKRAKQKEDSKLPYYTKIADIETFIFNRLKLLVDHKTYQIRRANNNDIDQMQIFYNQDVTPFK